MCSPALLLVQASSLNVSDCVSSRLLCNGTNTEVHLDISASDFFYLLEGAPSKRIFMVGYYPISITHVLEVICFFPQVFQTVLFTDRAF